MDRRFEQSREIGGRDALDSKIRREAPIRAVARLDLLLRSRAALGLAPATAPAILFVPLGWLLGPAALGVLTPGVLHHMDFAVSVALAALGLFVGLGLNLRRASERALLVAASLEASLTIVAVGLVTFAGLSYWRPDTSGLDAALFAALLGIIASASSGGAAEVSADPLHRTATRVADLDDVVPILVSGLLIPWVARHEPAAAAWALLGSGVVGLALAAAGWLLFKSTRAADEHAVFLFGLVLLLGGTAAHLAVSPLLTGMVAGIVWRRAPGHVDLVAREYLSRVQHPLVLLLLLTAGASVALTPPLIWLFVPLVVVRFAAKVTGGHLASRLVSMHIAAPIGWYLLPPGVLGLAFALNAAQVAPTAGPAIVGIAVAGALISELLALFLWPSPPRQA